MKPTTFLPTALALALTGLAGSAGAQSNVTLYGLVDLNVTNYKLGSEIGGGNVTILQDGTINGLNGSRWGLRVTEDLGGGLKAGVVAESGFAADSGNALQGGRAFGRQVFVSLTHSAWGDVRFGRQYVLQDGVQFYAAPFGNAAVLNPGTAVTNNGLGLPQWLNAPRLDNILQYRTPVWAGFSAAVQIAPGEGVNDRFHGVGATYVKGPIAAGFSYEWNRDRLSGDDTNKSLTLGGNYNLGFLKLFAGYQRNTDLTTNPGNTGALGNLVVTGEEGTFTATDIDGYTVGVEVPVGAWTFGIDYVLSKYEDDADGSQDLGKAAIAAKYALSKNTFLYAGGSIATGDLKDYIRQDRVLQAGLRMAF